MHCKVSNIKSIRWEYEYRRKKSKFKKKLPGVTR